MPSVIASPPHSIEAESAVLGAILREPECLIGVSGILKPENFFVESHEQIYEAMLELDSQNEPTDLLTVADKLRSKNIKAISSSFLVDLTERCPFTENIDYYANIVKQNFYLRKIVETCQKTINKATSYQGDVETFIEAVEKDFLSVSSDQDSQGLTPAKEVLIETLEDLEERIANDGTVTGVTSGFYDLDAVTSGWQQTDLIILAARPAMGKTALALNFAANAVKSGFPTAIFSLEMAKKQLLMRVLSSEAKIDSTKLRRGDLNEEEQDRLVHGARMISDFPAMLSIDETPAITMPMLRSRCRRFKKEHGLGLIVIDYLQLMGSHSKGDSREREISEISMGLKGLAKELSVPIIALAQLNRGPDSRPDKRPKLSDLRESGSMEQDADLILFVYRDEYYNPTSEDAGKAEVIIGKNRHGQTDTVRLAYLPNFVSFHNLMGE